MTFRVVSAEKFQEQRNIYQGSPVFPVGMFQTKICVPFLQTVSDTSSSFLVVKLISANGKRDSGTKFTSLKFA